MKTLRAFLAETDYRGEHEAPDHQSGAPLYDVTLNGIYPADFYGPNGYRYYGDQGNSYDQQNFFLVTAYQNKPNRYITVYRAIPKDIKGRSLIKPGDWVTLHQRYAKDHGMHALNGQYRITKLLVHARDLFTDGNSLEEWGYDPQPAVPLTPDQIARKKERHAKWIAELEAKGQKVEDVIAASDAWMKQYLARKK